MTEAVTEHAIESFMTKHGQTERLPPNSLYVTDDFEVCPRPRFECARTNNFQTLDPRVETEENATYTSFRLQTQEEDQDEPKEVTMYTVGVLTQKLLPPFKPKR